MSINPKLHEGFTKFFENPSRTALRELLKNEVGELDNLDFKETYPEKSKLAKHLLAMSNSGGGILVIGVKDGDTPESKGIERIIDKSDLNNILTPFLPDGLVYEVLDFPFKSSEYGALVGKTFQVILVDDLAEQIPFLSLKAGTNIKLNTLYIRRKTQSTEANHNEFNKVINRRIDSGHSSTSIDNLEEDLRHLKMLYNSINKTSSDHQFAETFSTIARQIGMFSKDNPDYPNENFNEFIAEAIRKKKIKICKLLGI
ncbi:AlbA family DNA-binding domain-containing protein [Marinicella rhabdoformis]|uniref:AlbA family DNA-binding domain-containing protein n=1 Tax=Marinicella rhabdoformis TaxID=2580566 RepID=UPI0012AEB20E|nr:ATP-binding protein [Marinicella rhabdoformis]